MVKRLILIAILATAFLTSAHFVRADGLPGAVYVDTSYTGSEDGTQTHPYNTLQEGRALAQTQSGGAWIYLKQNGSWIQFEYVPAAQPGVTGTPLADAVLYTLLVVLAVALILVGWQLWRRSQQLHGRDRALKNAT